MPEWIDVYLVHWPDPNTLLDETMAALDYIVRQGKARYVGVSNFRLWQIEAAMRLRRADVVQYAWNMFDRRMQTEIVPYCAAQQIGAVDCDCNTRNDGIRPDDHALHLWLRDRQRRSDGGATEQQDRDFAHDHI